MLGTGSSAGQEPERESDRGYSLAETLIVPLPGDTVHGSFLSDISCYDPKEIVKKYWRGSFSHQRKRKMTQSKSKIRRQILLGEELKRLENENGLWRDNFSASTGVVSCLGYT